MDGMTDIASIAFCNLAPCRPYKHVHYWDGHKEYWRNNRSVPKKCCHIEGGERDRSD